MDWIIISGAGGGIGKTISPWLIEQGYGVIGVGRENTQHFVEKLQSSYDHLHYLFCEYTDEKSVENTFEKAKAITDRISGAIHTVGGSLISKEIKELDLQDFRKVLSVNLDSTFLFVREVFRWMETSNGGNIILFGSTTGIEPSSGKMPYGVAKSAVHNMTFSCALEGSKYGIITNTIAPAYVLTPRHVKEIKQKAERKAMSETEVRADLENKNPLRGILKTEELLPTVKLLLETQVIQGQIIKVDLGQVGI